MNITTTHFRRFFLFALLTLANLIVSAQTYTTSRETLRDSVDPLGLRPSQSMIINTNGLSLVFKPVVGSVVSDNAVEFNSVKRPGYKWVYNWKGEAEVFGVVADEVTDDTAALQAALDYGKANRITVKLPGRGIVINSVTMDHQAMVGEWSSRQGYGGVYGGGTHLIHKQGATNHMIRMIGAGTAERGCYLANMSLEGRAGYNSQNKKLILASTNRFEFFVATNDLPSNGGSTAAWPYFGQVFFYTSESKYVGHGVATNINYTTGAVTLHRGFDQFATLSSTDYLSAGWYATFSPKVTAYDDRSVAISVIDPSAAGWCGISMESTTNLTGIVASVMNPVIKNVFIRGFHAGIRSGIGLAPHTQEVWITGCNFAGVCAAFGGYSYDWNMSQSFLQGFYSDWNANTHPETLTLKNKAYRYQAYGIYGLDTTGMLGDLTLDHNVNGAYMPHGADTHIPSILVDGAIGYGLIFDSSRFGSRVHYALPSVTIRSWSSYDLVNFGVPQIALGKRYAIYSLGKNGSTYPPIVQVGMLNTTRSSDATNDFDALFHSDNALTKFQIIGLWQTNGVLAITSSNSLSGFTTGHEIDRVAPAGGLIWNGTNDSYVSAATTGYSIGTSNFTVWVKARLPESPAPITVCSLWGLSTSSSSAGTGRAIYSGFTSSGNFYTTLNGASSSDGRTAIITGMFTDYPGKVVDIIWRRTSGVLTVNVNGRNKTYTESTFGSPPTNFAETISNNYSLVGRGDKAWSDRIYRFALWNRSISDAEVESIPLYGIPASDRWGNASRTGCVQDLNLGIGSGTNIVDRSTNAFNGTLVGTNVFHIE